MKHKTTIILTLGGLAIILTLAWLGMLPPAPEQHVEQIVREHFHD